MAVGRPPLYKPEYCQMVIDFMSKGNSATQFAAEVGVGKDTVYEWAKRYPEFTYAFKAARTRCEAFWEQVVKARSVQKLPGSDYLLNFYMKNRFGWSEKQAIEHTGRDGGPIKTIDLSKLSDEQLAKLEQIASAVGLADDQGGTEQT